MSDPGEIVPGNRPDWLTSVWTEVKDSSGVKVMYYRNTETGQTFYCKEDLRRYINMGNVCRSSPEPIGNHSELRTETKPAPVVVKTVKIPRWLPRGWSMEIRTRENGMQFKCYVEPESGRRFYSKPKVFEYLENVYSRTTTKERPNADPQTGEESSPVLDASQRNETPEWLPDGWTMELKTHGSGKSEGKTYKCFVDPETGRKFFSKPQVYDYLKTVNSSVGRQKRPNVDPQTGEESSPVLDASQRNETPEWLPDGWTMELKTHGSGKSEGKTYKCFVDPETGRKFFSKPQVYDYLKTVNSSVGGEKRPNADPQTGEESSPVPDASQRNETPEWLPDGWTMELKTHGSGKKEGKTHKCFVDPETGRKFFSKPQVYDYLKTVNSSVGGQKRPNANPQTGEESSPVLDASHRNETPEWLPDGWTMELKTHGSGKCEGKTYKCFIDPETGRKFFSKPQVYDYLKTVNSSLGGQKRHEADHLVGEKSSSEPDGSQNCKSIMTKCSISELKKGGICKQSMEKHKVIERSSVDGLPPGWIKEVRAKRSGTGMRKDPYFIDPLSGYEFRSKVDALRYLEAGDIEKCAIRPKKGAIYDADSVNGDMNDTESVNEGLNHSECINEDIMVSERGSAEGLPPGWIREIRSRKSTNGTRKDPYYIDPLSGYEFRSKVDALRYLKTGDIKTCAIRPKKMGINGTKSVPEDNSPLCLVDGQESMQSSTKRQLFHGGLAASDVGSSKEREENSISHIDTDTEKHPNGTAKSDSEAKASFAESGTISTPATDRLRKLKSAEQNKQQTLTQSTKSKKDKASLPLLGRSSKRLKGFEPEMKGVSLFSERSIRVSARGISKQLEAEPKMETSGAAEEEQQERKIIDKQNDEKTEGKESELLCPLGDSSWLDPCLEFAVKTLTGAIPVEDNMIIQGVSNPPGT